MTLEQAIKQLDTMQQAHQAYRHAIGVLTEDGATAAPRQSSKGRACTVGYLSGADYRILVTDENMEAAQTILAAPEVDPMLRRRAELLRDELEELNRLPMDEYVAYRTLLTEADAAWHQAKEDDDYALFAPYLERIIESLRRRASLKNPDANAYDVLLDGYEKGLSTQRLDPFFALLREKLTPVILAVKEKPAPRTDFIHQHYPLHLQREFTNRLMAMMGIDATRCTIAETEHPCTYGFNKWDVRMSTNYSENNVIDSMYSVIHEGGHALYNLGVDDRYQFTSLDGGVSMSIHESQSRFYENLIGRSLPFCEALLPVMRSLFPQQLEGVTPEMLYRAVNKAEPSLIRVEADELTYPMHIMIRYELEKRMLAGDVTVKEIPALWNDMYRSYLGVTVPNDRSGVLQDMHWGSGMMGYFPSYALGSAYGVQMLHAMSGEVDVWSAARAGDLRPVTAWLGEKIHRHGRMMTTDEVLQNVLGAPFDPNCYVDYLTGKFSELYQL